MRLCKYTPEIIEDTLAHIKELMTNNKELKDLSLAVPTIKAPKATIIYSEKADKKREALVEQSSKEIAWHMLITKTYNQKQEPIYIVDDVIMFPQTVTAATVTSDDTEYAKWISSLDDATFNKLKGHGHSHVNMGVIPSTVDDDYQDAIKNNIEQFYVFEIINKRGDQWIMIYDFEDNIQYDKADIKIIHSGFEYTDWAKTKIAEYVKSATYKPTISAQTAGYSYWQQQAMDKINKQKEAEKKQTIDDDPDWYTEDSFWEEWEKANAEHDILV